jgi:hypothetical protein
MFGGKKKWLPGKSLAKLITANFGIPEREQKLMVERISDAIADTAPTVREMMEALMTSKTPESACLRLGARGVNHLGDSRMYGMSQWKSSNAFEGISEPQELVKPRLLKKLSDVVVFTSFTK